MASRDRDARGFSTLAIHGDHASRDPWTPVASPIVQSSTFISPVGTSEGLMYTRYGNNPNQVELGRRLALLEGTEAGAFVSSGMGAIALAHLAMLRPGDHLVSSRWIYGGTLRLFKEEFAHLGIDVSFVDPSEPRAWKPALRSNTRALFLETPTNPLTRVIDLGHVSRLSQQEGIALIVDSTLATPLNFRPAEHGADIVIHSATKFLNGHSDVIAGAVAGTDSVISEVLNRMQVWGQALDPFAAWLIERGMKTLALRVERQNANALGLAKALEGHKGVERVHYPGLPTHPDHKLAKKLMSGFGGILGVEVKGGAEGAERMLKRLRVARHAPSLGGVETLVSEPRLTSHAGLSPAERAEVGIPDGFVRISVGVEDLADLIADFDAALGRAA